jgi:hypothetical protein
VGRAGQQFDDLRFVEITVPAANAQTHVFARQGAADEDSLAVNAGNAATVVDEIGDLGFEFFHHYKKYRAPASADPGAPGFGKKDA